MTSLRTVGKNVPDDSAIAGLRSVDYITLNCALHVLLLKMDRALSPALRCAALVYETNGEIICG